MIKRGFKKRINITDAVILGILGMLAFIMVFPFYNMFIISFARYESIIKYPIYLFPVSFDFSSYKFILSEPAFIKALGVSAFVTVISTLLSIICSTAAAYAFSKRNIPGVKLIMRFIIFSMFFSGGLIPYYLQMKSLHLIDNVPVLVLSGFINTFYLIIMRNFFFNVPKSLEDSAKIDGANDLYILFKIIIPVSAPIIATMLLFYSVDRWNDWWTALIFISNPKLRPMQIVLRNIVIDRSSALTGDLSRAVQQSERPVYPMSLRMSTIFITTLPILLVYPFLQKYFMHGLMLGSIKA